MFLATKYNLWWISCEIVRYFWLATTIISTQNQINTKKNNWTISNAHKYLKNHSTSPHTVLFYWVLIKRKHWNKHNHYCHTIFRFFTTLRKTTTKMKNEPPPQSSPKRSKMLNRNGVTYENQRKISGRKNICRQPLWNQYILRSKSLGKN